MAKMRPPVLPEWPVPVLGEDKTRALLKACAGSGFVRMEERSGRGQEFVQLANALLRAMGSPARYASGGTSTRRPTPRS